MHDVDDSQNLVPSKKKVKKERLNCPKMTIVTAQALQKLR